MNFPKPDPSKTTPSPERLEEELFKLNSMPGKIKIVEPYSLKGYMTRISPWDHKDYYAEGLSDFEKMEPPKKKKKEEG